MKLAAIHHVAIIVSDYEKSKDFYVNKLGFAPGQLGASFSLVLPMPLPPEVAKGMMVLPFKL